MDEERVAGAGGLRGHGRRRRVTRASRRCRSGAAPTCGTQFRTALAGEVHPVGPAGGAVGDSERAEVPIAPWTRDSGITRNGSDSVLWRGFTDDSESIDRDRMTRNRRHARHGLRRRPA